MNRKSINLWSQDRIEIKPTEGYGHLVNAGWYWELGLIIWRYGQTSITWCTNDRKRITRKRLAAVNLSFSFRTPSITRRNPLSCVSMLLIFWMLSQQNFFSFLIHAFKVKNSSSTTLKIRRPGDHQRWTDSQPPDLWTQHLITSSSFSSFIGIRA